MGGWSRSHASEFSFCELLEVRLVRVVVIGLEVAKGRRYRVESVIGDGDGLGVAQFREGLHVEAVVGLSVVALGCGDVRPVRNGFASEQADAGVVATFREVVADLQAVFTSAEVAGRLGGKVVR